jgi:uridine phosphorylase
MVANGLSTLEEECSNRGKEWQKIRDQRNKEVAQGDIDTIKRIAAIAKQLASEKAANPEMESINIATVLAVGGAQTAPGAFLAAANQPTETGDDTATEPSKEVSDAA